MDELVYMVGCHRVGIVVGVLCLQEIGLENRKKCVCRSVCLVRCGVLEESGLRLVLLSLAIVKIRELFGPIK